MVLLHTCIIAIYRTVVSDSGLTMSLFCLFLAVQVPPNVILCRKLEMDGVRTEVDPTLVGFYCGYFLNTRYMK